MGFLDGGGRLFSVVVSASGLQGISEYEALFLGLCCGWFSWTDWFWFMISWWSYILDEGLNGEGRVTLEPSQNHALQVE